MPPPNFEIATIGNNCHAVNDGGRTVAIVTRQGYVDWLLRSPLDHGPLIGEIHKETHLSYTLGLKLQLTCPRVADDTPGGTEMTRLEHRIEGQGGRLVLIADGVSRDGLFLSRTTAELALDETTARYAWRVRTEVRCVAGQARRSSWIEYNNIYPGFAGRCMLFSPYKQYRWTLLRDKDGVVWRFPHQHTMHYGAKIRRLRFGPAAMAGFFGEDSGSPVVVVEESDLQPDWDICDRYYDLHCGARLEGPIEPGGHFAFTYRIKYTSHGQKLKALLQGDGGIIR